MEINQKSIEKLRELINEETENRSGPQLVRFFNDLGFNDSYGQGFPSRWIYTEDKIKSINGTPDLDKCIKKLFDPINFIGKIDKLDNHIKNFNQYLAFDKWEVLRKGTEITFKRAGKIELHNNAESENSENFLDQEFDNISLDELGLTSTVTEILKTRFEEIKKCFRSKAHLSVIFMCGSSLEGILLGVALENPKDFNQALSAPKDRDGKVKIFPDWTLSQLIDVASEVGFLKEDVKKFSHSLRDFRNYIHPYQQVSTGFNPDHHTANICFQVLKAAIYQISRRKKASA